MALNFFDLLLSGDSMRDQWGPSWKTPEEAWEQQSPAALTPVPVLPEEVTVVVVMGSHPEADLRQTVDSARFQSHPPAEILVLDNGQHPGAVASVKHLPGVRVIQHPAAHPAAARNHGFLMARHDVLAFLTAGDVWPVDCLAGQTALLQTHQNVDMVLGQVQSQAFSRETVQGLSFHLGSALIRRSVFSRVGLFDESHPLEDLEWLMRVREMGLHVALREEVTLWASTPEAPPDRRELKRKSFLSLQKIVR